MGFALFENHCSQNTALTCKNGPKVGFAALVKSGHMLETPLYPLVLAIFAIAVTIHRVRTISRKGSCRGYDF